MERHKCKLCSRSFSSGKALGGHMRSHLATLPIPPKTLCLKKPQLGELTDSTSSLSSSSSEEERESEDKGLIYGLRENPKRSFRLVDPQFLDAGSVVVQVQDRESETESTRMPTRKRSKRTKCTKPSSTESEAELEQVSSVCDTSSDEDVALCLMMLSRDVWRKQSHKKMKNCFENHEGESKKSSQNITTKNVNQKVHKCPFCYKVFGSGQALGGHKRSHFLGSSTTSSASAKLCDNLVPEKSAGILIDLNLPAPMEGEDFSQLEVSALSDAEVRSSIPSSIDTIIS